MDFRKHHVYHLQVINKLVTAGFSIAQELYDCSIKVNVVLEYIEPLGCGLCNTARSPGMVIMFK